MTNPKNIFISYAREDLSRVNSLVELLKAEGWEVWWDRKNLSAGHQYHQIITDAIQDAACIVVCWSNASVKSNWVIAEANEGLEHRKLVPIFLESVRPPVPFGSYHTIDLNDWNNETSHDGYISLKAELQRFQTLDKNRIRNIHKSKIEEKKEFSKINEINSLKNGVPAKEITHQAPKSATRLDLSQTHPDKSNNISSEPNKVIFDNLDKNVENFSKISHHLRYLSDLSHKQLIRLSLISIITVVPIVFVLYLYYKFLLPENTEIASLPVKTNNSVVLLVHGMGAHSRGQITKDYTKALKKSAACLGIQNTDFLNKTDYVEFHYSNNFDAIRAIFTNSAEARAQGFSYLKQKGFNNILIKQLEYFESKLGKSEFLYTRWLDVLLYATDYYGERIRLNFAKEFLKILSNYEFQDIHIVSHSLGTAVVHDSLAKLYRTESNPFDGIPDIQTGVFNINSLWTLANISRQVNLLNNLTHPYDSTVTTGERGVVHEMVNVIDQNDDLTKFKPYRRPNIKNYLLIQKKSKQKQNTHAFSQYISDLNVSRAMLRIMFGKRSTNHAFQDCFAKYKQAELSKEANNLAPLKEFIETLNRQK